MKVIALSLISALGLTSCYTTNPYTGERQLSKTTSASVIGGIAGALAGSLSGKGSTDRRQKAMIGAGIGALAGGFIGNYMDRQEAELRAELESSGVSISRSGNDLILNMPGDVTFPVNRSDINSGFYPTLSSVSKVLTKYNKTLVDVTGHTDSTGSRDYNYKLSQRRAASVASYLESHGILAQRLLITGRGPDDPKFDNKTAAGRQQNRRVTIHLRALQQ